MKKNKNYYSIVALILMAVMLVSLFSSCNKKKEINNSSDSSISINNSSTLSSDMASESSSATSNSETGNSNISSSKPGTSSTPAEDPADWVTKEFVISPDKDPKLVEQPKNLGGKTFKLVTWYPNDWPKGTPITRQGEINKEALAKVQQDYNCTIDVIYVNYTTYLQDVATSMTAGKIYADIFDTHGPASDLYRSGYLADLSTVSTIGLKKNEWNSIVTRGTTYKGKIYGVGANTNDVLDHCNVIYFNQSIANKFNLGNFYDLVNQKKWTVDTMLTLAKKVYTQSNRTIAGFGSYFASYFSDVVFTNGSSPLKADASGKILFNGQDNGVLKMLDVMQQFSNSGAFYNKTANLMETGSIDANSNLWMKVAYDTQSAFANGKMLFYLTDAWMKTDLKNTMKDEYGLLPLPMGPDVNEYASVLSNIRFYSICSGNPDMEDVGRLVTALANRTFMKAADFNSNEGKVLRKESVDMERIILTSKFSYYPANLFGYNSQKKDDWTDSVVSILKGKKTPKEAMDGIANSAQGYIDAYYN